MSKDRPIPPSLLRRRQLPAHAVAPEPEGTPLSRLRKPNHHHPFAPFLAEDVAGIAASFASGFDPLSRDEKGMTCAMHCAERGLAQSLHLALEGCADPAALVSAKLESELDAFDLAAAAGAVACLVEISRRLPRTHRSGIERGFMWHAVEASSSRADLAQAWLVDLCAAPKSLFTGRDAVEALTRAREIGWQDGIAMLASHLGVPAAVPANPASL